MCFVTEMTDPDWVPIMKIASAIVTDKGGRTCHAAVVSRELGIPCVVGTGNASELIHDGQGITVSCAGGGDEGQSTKVYCTMEIETTDVEGAGTAQDQDHALDIGEPERAFGYSLLPNDGVGLAREELIIDSHIKIHRSAHTHFDQIGTKNRPIPDQHADQGVMMTRRNILSTSWLRASRSSVRRFIPMMSSSDLAIFAQRVRQSLIGGTQFEPEERNPMIVGAALVATMMRSIKPFCPRVPGSKSS